MNLTEIKELFENVSNGKITEKNKEDASTLLTALKDAKENLKFKKILLQIDPDDDFGIDETQGYKVEKNIKGFYEITINLMTKVDIKRAVLKCLKELNYRTSEYKKYIISDISKLIMEIEEAVDIIDTHYYGNLSISIYELEKNKEIKIGDLKINLDNS